MNGPDGSPVDADGTQVEDAGGAHHDVQREKNITVDPTEPPFTNNLHTHTSEKSAQNLIHTVLTRTGQLECKRPCD